MADELHARVPVWDRTRGGADLVDPLGARLRRLEVEEDVVGLRPDRTVRPEELPPRAQARCGRLAVEPNELARHGTPDRGLVRVPEVPVVEPLVEGHGADTAERARRREAGVSEPRLQ